MFRYIYQPTSAFTLAKTTSSTQYLRKHNVCGPERSNSVFNLARDLAYVALECTFLAFTVDSRVSGATQVGATSARVEMPERVVRIARCHDNVVVVRWGGASRLASKCARGSAVSGKAVGSALQRRSYSRAACETSSDGVVCSTSGAGFRRATSRRNSRKLARALKCGISAKDSMSVFELSMCHSDRWIISSKRISQKEQFVRMSNLS